MTNYVFPAYAFRNQKGYMHRHLEKLGKVKVSSFISKLQELDTYLAELPPDTEGE